MVTSHGSRSWIQLGLWKVIQRAECKLQVEYIQILAHHCWVVYNQPDCSIIDSDTAEYWRRFEFLYGTELIRQPEHIIPIKML